MANVLKIPRNTTDAGKLRPAIQGMQKRGPEECVGNCSPQLVVRGCGYLLVVALLR